MLNLAVSAKLESILWHTDTRTLTHSLTHSLTRQSEVSDLQNNPRGGAIGIWHLALAPVFSIGEMAFFSEHQEHPPAQRQPRGRHRVFQDGFSDRPGMCVCQCSAAGCMQYRAGGV